MNADQTTFIGSNWLDATFRVERNGTPAPSMQAD
jgi:hypothetical protein